jgi:hypothetical protein
MAEPPREGTRALTLKPTWSNCDGEALSSAGLPKVESFVTCGGKVNTNLVRSLSPRHPKCRSLEDDDSGNFSHCQEAQNCAPTSRAAPKRKYWQSECFQDFACNYLNNSSRQEKFRSFVSAFYAKERIFLAKFCTRMCSSEPASRRHGGREVREPYGVRARLTTLP